MIGLMLIYLLSIKKAKSPNYATIPISLTSILCSVFFVDDNENDDENDKIVSNFRRRD